MSNEQVDVVDNSSFSNSNNSKTCCSWWKFKNNVQAKGIANLGIARGPMIMSNIFLSTSLIYLASGAAGCYDNEQKVIDNCTGKVYGFKPSSFITNIAVISGLMSAFFMPFVGALVDYTSHRKLIGIVTAVVMILIQGVQIGTVSSTWYIMAILQAITGFFYQVQVLATYAYYPEVARSVGQTAFTEFTVIYQMLQFTSQCIFLVVISVIGFVLALNDVTLAHVSQSINVIWSGAAFALGWKLMDDIPPHNTLPDGRNLFTEGFLQTFRTFCNIMHHYRDGFFMYLLAVVFAEAGANAFTVVSVLYLNETLKMGGAEIGMVMLLTLFATLPGSKLGEFVTKKTNPNTSWKLSMVSFIIFTAAASFVLDSPERKNFAYLWAVFWGISLGWFYPTENVFFAMSLPQGQEAELTGFFIYCTQVIVWFPPMLFTWLNESGVNQKWGLMTINIFFFIAICLLMMIKPWDEVIKDARKIDDNDEERQSQQQEDKA